MQRLRDPLDDGDGKECTVRVDVFQVATLDRLALRGQGSASRGWATPAALALCMLLTLIITIGAVIVPELLIHHREHQKDNSSHAATFK